MAAGQVNVVSRRRGYYDNSKKGFDRYRNGERHHVSLRSSNNFDFKRNGFSCRNNEQGMGGWWGNGLDPYPGYKDGEKTKCDYGVQLPPEKKRKFSPIIWDVEDKATKILLNNRVVTKSVALSPPTSPLRACSQGLNIVSDGGFVKNPVSESQECVSDKDCVERLGDINGFESPATLSPSSPQEKHEGVDHGVGQVEEEEIVETRNISMSRWASDSDTPRDATLCDDGDTPGETVYRNNSSPESGEFRREVSDGDRLRLHGSCERVCSMGLDRRDEDSECELQDDDLMDIEETRDENAGVYQRESDDDSSQIEGLTTATERSVNMLEGCRSVYDFERLNEINEGTYGKVYKARDKRTGEIVALKRVKMDVRKDKNLEEYGFPLSSLREMNILLSFRHPSIVDIKEVVMGDLDSVFLVMEYMEHDLKALMQVMKQPFSTSEVKCLMLQLLEGVKGLHDNWVLHRDLKTSNLLLNNQGQLKICDFGMSRRYGSPLKPYTPLVVTLWYRAPELLLGAKQYSTAVDMWSVGCIMAELLAKEPLFKGKNEIDQLDKIFRTLGTPNEKIWPGLSKLPEAKPNFVKQPYNLLRKKFPAASFTGSPILSDLGLDLLNKLLTYDPEKRITADAALNHAWFHEVPLPKSREFMPTFPPQHAKSR